MNRYEIFWVEVAIKWRASAKLRESVMYSILTQTARVFPLRLHCAFNLLLGAMRSNRVTWYKTLFWTAWFLTKYQINSKREMEIKMNSVLLVQRSLLKNGMDWHHFNANSLLNSFVFNLNIYPRTSLSCKITCNKL